MGARTDRAPWPGVPGHENDFPTGLPYPVIFRNTVIIGGDQTLFLIKGLLYCVDWGKYPLPNMSNPNPNPNPNLRTLPLTYEP